MSNYSVALAQKAPPAAPIDLDKVIEVLNREAKKPPRARLGKENECDIMWGSRAIMVTSLAEDWEAEIGRVVIRALKLQKRPSLLIIQDPSFTEERFKELKLIARAKRIELGLLDRELAKFIVELGVLPPLNINTVTQEELEAVPGIGPDTAATIIAVRKQLQGFKSLADLQGVPGLGAKKIQSLRRAQLLIP